MKKSKKSYNKLDSDYKTVYQNGDGTLMRHEFLDTLQKEVEEALDQIKCGEFVSIDEAFEAAKASYRNNG